MGHMKFLELFSLVFLFASIASCGGDKKQSLKSDEDFEYEELLCDSFYEFSPPDYCKEAMTWKKTRDLPLSKNVNCLLQCDAELKCEVAGYDPSLTDFQFVREACLNVCNKKGSYDYLQFSTCEEMNQKVRELTMEYVATADLPECRNDGNPVSEGPDADNPCRIACANLIARCQSFVDLLHEGYHDNSDIEYCSGICYSQFGIDDLQTEWLVDKSKTVSCVEAECMLSNSCNWQVKKLDYYGGDEDAVDEPMKTDYEITP